MLCQLKVSYFQFVNLFGLLKSSRVCIDGQPDGDHDDPLVNFRLEPLTDSVESQPGLQRTDPPEITSDMVEEVYVKDAKPSELIFKTIKVRAFENTGKPKAGNNVKSQKNRDRFLKLIHVQLEKYSNAMNMIYFSLMVLKRWPKPSDFDSKTIARFESIYRRIMWKRLLIKRVCNTSAAYGVFYNYALTISNKCRQLTNYVVDLQDEYNELDDKLEAIETVARELCSFIQKNLLTNFTIDHPRNEVFLKKMNEVARNLKQLQEEYFKEDQTEEFNKKVAEYAIQVIKIVDRVCPANSGILPE